MNELKYLIIHCPWTKPSFKLRKEHIIDWHTKPKPEGNGWSRPGYADGIFRDGSLENLVPFDQDQFVDANEMTWGVKGINGIARHLFVEGGRTEEGGYANPLQQFPEMEEPLLTYCRFTVLRHPDIKIGGHYQFDDKKPFCPGWDVESWLFVNDFKKENIFVN